MKPRTVWMLLALAVIALVTIVVSSGSGSDSDTGGVSTTSTVRSTADAQTAEPQRRKVSGSHDAPAPVLMYHVITDPPADATYTDLYVSAREFRGQIDALARAGFHGVTLGQLLDYWEEGYELPPKPVVVSFDDGYRSQYKNAAPVLRRHGWPGVLNLEVKNLKPSWGLSVDQVRQLAAQGWEVGSHTINHLDMSTLDAVGLKREAAGSRRMLERRLGLPIDFFCYPSGRFNDAAVAAVRRAGYRGATTTEPGLARPADPYRLARVRIDRGQSPQSVVALAKGGA